MATTGEKKQPGKDLGNANENETRQAESPEDKSPEFDEEGRLVPSGTEPGVTEEESKLAEKHADGGAPMRRRS